MCHRKTEGWAFRENKRKVRKMEKITVNAKAQLDELKKGSALTFLGCINTDEEIQNYFGWIREKATLKRERMYIVSGKVMNEAYGLTGDNALQDELVIFCVKQEDIGSPAAIITKRFELNGHWFDDVVRNLVEAQREIDG